MLQHGEKAYVFSTDSNFKCYKLCEQTQHWTWYEMKRWLLFGGAKRTESTRVRRNKSQIVVMQSGSKEKENVPIYTNECYFCGMARIQTDKDVSRKEVILKASAKLFREKGYKAASMRDLAVKVGVEAASLYNHIRSKAELLHDICFNVANLFFEHISMIETSNAPAIEKLETLLRFHIKQMIENFEEVYVTDREWRYLAEPYLSNYQNQRRSYRKRFAAVIQQGIEEGQINKIDASTAVLILLHAIGGIESWHRSTHKISGEVLEENMVTILIDGLKK